VSRTFVFAVLALAAPVALAAPTTQPAQPSQPAQPAVTAPVTNPPAPSTATPVVDPDANKKVCKSNIPTGSRIARGQICKTKAQWEAQSAANQQAFEDARQRSLGTTRSGS
jgi:curli biogenesis system outer membrane secretion channel CsgG